MLEALLAHLDTAATNGSAAAEAPAAEKTAESAAEEPKKDETTPAEVSLVPLAYRMALLMYQSTFRCMVRVLVQEYLCM